MFCSSIAMNSRAILIASLGLADSKNRIRSLIARDFVCMGVCQPSRIACRISAISSGPTGAPLPQPPANPGVFPVASASTSRRYRFRAFLLGMIVLSGFAMFHVRAYRGSVNSA